jgi:hypothetical protein
MTGSQECVELLQKYLDMTGDVQELILMKPLFGRKVFGQMFILR